MSLNDFFISYVSSFFAPTTTFIPDRWPFHAYHIQKNVPPGKNPILQRRPEIIKKVEAMPVDFEQELLSNMTKKDRLQSLHASEKKMREMADLPDLMVNKNVLKQTMEKVMNLPRNLGTNPAVRESIGGYLYGRMGRAGLVTYMQTFQTTRPKLGGGGVSGKPIRG